MTFSFLPTFEIEMLKFEFLCKFTLLFCILGFVENRRACCGNGRFNGESPCTPNATLCSDRQHYIFWDKAHLTQAFYNLSMNIAYDDQHSNTIPINIRKLVSFWGSIDKTSLLVEVHLIEYDDFTIKEKVRINDMKANVFHDVWMGDRSTVHNFLVAEYHDFFFWIFSWIS